MKSQCRSRWGYVTNDSIYYNLRTWKIIICISFFEGICLYLRKDDSKLYWYNCTHFQQGCPTKHYRGSTIYERKFVLNYKASKSGSDLIF